MLLGRYQKGAWLPVSVQCRDNLVVLAPDNAPVMTIYDSSFSTVLAPRSIPPRALGRRTGLFEIEQFLGSEFSEGIYHILVTYSATVATMWRGGVAEAFETKNFADLLRFEVVPAGHESGAYINLYFYERPHADYVVGQLDADVLEFRKNPAAADG